MLSNDMLQKAIGTYKEASELPNATPDLIKATLKKRAERQQFLGNLHGQACWSAYTHTHYTVHFSCVLSLKNIARLRLMSFGKVVVVVVVFSI